MYVPSQHPPGTVAVVMGELSRYTDFEVGMDQLQVPPGTALVRVKGPSVAKNRNDVVEKNLRGEWVMFIDDDNVVQPDTLLKLLSHEVDIVGGLYSLKRPPFAPVAFKATLPNGKFRPFTWTELHNGPRLVETVGSGTGSMLIRTHVFKKLEKPWFHWGFSSSDDMYFCDKAREAGFKTWVDREAAVGHVSTMVVWPSLDMAGALIQLDWFHIGIEDDAGNVVRAEED